MISDWQIPNWMWSAESNVNRSERAIQMVGGREGKFRRHPNGRWTQYWHGLVRTGKCRKCWRHGLLCGSQNECERSFSWILCHLNLCYPSMFLTIHCTCESAKDLSVTSKKFLPLVWLFSLTPSRKTDILISNGQDVIQFELYLLRWRTKKWYFAEVFLVFVH